MLPDVADQLLAMRPDAPGSHLRKAIGPDPELQHQIANALRDLGLSGFAALVDPTTEVLEAVAAEGARLSVATLRALVPNAEDFAMPADTVRQWALDHAAELVGMRVLEDGTVIVNPNPRYAIAEKTREMLRTTIAAAFQEDTTRAGLIEELGATYAFSEERAAVIARTEVTRALVAGNKLGWKASGVVVGKQSILSDLHDKDDDCDENESAGVIPVDEPYPSGDDSVPFHPACSCDEVPALAGEEEEGD